MIRLGIIGAGRIGQIHASNVSQHPQASLDVVVDVSAEAAETLASACGATTDSVDGLLENDAIDAVIVASSTDTHAELIIRAAEQGKAIFCEKPLDLDIETAKRAVQCANQADVMLCLGFNRRHDPSFARVKAEIDSGSVGSVEMVTITSRDPSPPPADYVGRSGGLFRDMMIHDFDMARWLLGEEPVEVFAVGSVLVDEAIGNAGDVDTAAATLRTASGRLCQINNSRRCSYGYDQRIEVFGSRGMSRAGNARETRVEVATEQGFQRDVVLPFFLERYANAYRLQLEKFVDAAQGGAVELPDGHDGIRALELADAAQLAVDEGRPVAV